MILKYYELNKIKLDNNFILFHGKNPGLKIEEIHKINNKFKSKITNYDEKQILENKEEFFETILNKSLFDEKKTIIINRVSDKFYSIAQELNEKEISDILFILNAEILDKKSKLRNFFEKSKTKYISVAFYPDTNETLFKLASDFLNKQEISLSRENINLLLQNPIMIEKI